VHQDERAGVLWSGGGEEDRGRGGVDLGQDGGPLRADLVQDHAQLLSMRFPWRQRIRGRRVRGTRAAPVEQDQPRKRRKRPEKQGNPRVLPGDVDGDSAGHDQVGRPLAEHLVGDPVLTQPGVPRLRQHTSPLTRGPAEILSRSAEGLSRNLEFFPDNALSYVQDF
jgi:hypothetical protein